jgi:hypothetical protein
MTISQRTPVSNFVPSVPICAVARTVSLAVLQPSVWTPCGMDAASAADRRSLVGLAAALDLDMRQWWQPTATSYFGRASQARILDAVTEAISNGAADNLVKLKKDALAIRAEGKIVGSGWLPPILRRVTVSVMSDVSASDTNADPEMDEAA